MPFSNRLFFLVLALAVVVDLALCFVLAIARCFDLAFAHRSALVVTLAFPLYESIFFF